MCSLLRPVTQCIADWIRSKKELIRTEPFVKRQIRAPTLSPSDNDLLRRTGCNSSDGETYFSTRFFPWIHNSHGYLPFAMNLQKATNPGHSNSGRRDQREYCHQDFRPDSRNLRRESGHMVPTGLHSKLICGVSSSAYPGCTYSAVRTRHWISEPW